MFHDETKMVSYDAVDLKYMGDETELCHEVEFVCN